MAKGNLLLGTAANSVGDVVMYRREGAQVSRVRVRKVKNPKTAAQSLQRAFFAPVAKFYSPLSVVLERSFEGLSRSKSYSKFLKTNVDLARANGWLLPKGTGFFPLPYKLSEGTHRAPYVYATTQSINFEFPEIPAGTTVAQTVGFLSAQLINAGAKAGDVISCIFVKEVGTGNYVPKTFQFEVNVNDTTLLATLFSAIAVSTLEVEGESFEVYDDNQGYVAAACIVSRNVNGTWRRTVEKLHVKGGIIADITDADYKAAAIASYGMNAGDANPLVYLDGDTLKG